MNKKILIGSMLVFIMLLLMPSIPAIQLKIVEEKTFNNYIQKQNETKMKELEESINEWWKHPIINFLVVITFLRAWRGFSVLYFSLSNVFNPDTEPTIEHPIFFIRGLWLFATGAGFNSILYVFAKIMGWELII